MRAFMLAAAFRVALVAGGLLIPAMAAQANEVERDGYKFQYTSSVSKDGATVLTGTETVSGEPFRMVVRGRTVTGEVDGRPVRFRIARALHADNQVASR